jgi:uncharacterized protein (TIGR00297 family)
VGPELSAVAALGASPHPASNAFPCLTNARFKRNYLRMATEPLPLAHAAAIATSLAIIAWRMKTLNLGGAVAAALVGAAILGGTGWTGGAALTVFFVTSSAAGRLFPSQDQALDFKHTPRDGWQVWANGAAAAAGGLIGMTRPEAGLWVVTASLAAANADTWATEIGKAFGGTPRDLLSKVEVPPGTSGGVTLIGTVAAAAGAASVAVTAGLMAGSLVLGLAGTLLGFGGMLVDSAFGSSWQARNRCQICEAVGEEPRHCGTATMFCKGVRWITNGTVNAIATGLAGLGGGLAWWLALS